MNLNHAGNLQVNKIIMTTDSWEEYHDYHHHHHHHHLLASSSRHPPTSTFPCVISLLPSSLLLSMAGHSTEAEAICSPLIPNLWHLPTPPLCQHLPLGVQTCLGPTSLPHASLLLIIPSNHSLISFPLNIARMQQTYIQSLPPSLRNTVVVRKAEQQT